jgi:hypothetical protein
VIGLEARRNDSSSIWVAKEASRAMRAHFRHQKNAMAAALQTLTHPVF